LWLKEVKLDCCVLREDCHCPIQNDAELMEHAFAKKLQIVLGKYDVSFDFLI
jgi:hypothetical protein